LYRENKEFEEKLKKIIDPNRIIKIQNKKNNIVKMSEAMLKERHNKPSEMSDISPDSKVRRKRTTIEMVKTKI